MAALLFSDEIVNASELRSRQKYWLEKATSRPVTVTYGSHKLAIIDRESISKLFLQQHYLGLTIWYCEEALTGADSETFPWLKYLDDEEKEEFHSELIHSVSRAAKFDNWDDIEDLLGDWKATAETKNNPDVIKALSTKLNKGNSTAIE